MVCVGVDVSKGKSTVCFMKSFGEVLHPPFEVEHTASGLKRFTEKIKAQGHETRVVMESTGAYHIPLLTFLKEEGIFVAVVNPLIMSKYSKMSLRKGKTDRLDAIKIASYGLNYWHQLADYSFAPTVYDEMHFLNRQYLSYLSMRVKAKQALSTLLDKTMPGIKAVLWNRSDVPDRDKLSDFVSEYWHYDNITCMSESVFIDSYNVWAKSKRYRASTTKAKIIYALALEGISTLPSTTPSTKMLVLEAVGVLRMLDTTLVGILSRMRELAKTLPEYDIVMAMPGVGNVLGPRLIAEIGDVRRFHSASALVAYAGLDSPPFQSGNFKATNRSISKRGSSSLRKTGFEIMRWVKMSKPTADDAVYQYMLKKEAEGKPKKVAKIAALNKFLRIYYARSREIYLAV